jgi:predicted membrane protein
MTTQHYQQPLTRHSAQCSHSKNSRVALGALIVLIGGLILAKRLGLVFFSFPVWPLVVLSIGIYSGVKHNFRNLSSWVLITLGILFLIPKFMILGVPSKHLVAPVLLIMLGLYLIIRPARNFRRNHEFAPGATDDEVIHIDITFGERSSVVTSKNFKGGTISNMFSETKLNLMQADSPEPMVLDVKVSFGSLDILVPSHWDVEFQVANSFASVEDKRYLRVMAPEDKRTLVIKGSCTFGSVSIKSI